jgi:cell division protein FtsI/penicillin-binding protein 2
MMTTFGIGIDVTPLELAALTAAIANGGTLYYLQYPETQEQVQHFAPRVKRQLPIGRYVDDIKAGMLDAVESGTARGSAYGVDTPVLGKTGTCTDDRFATHLGWFASFNQSPSRSIVVVVLLTGGQPVHGGLAANIAGAIYRTLSQGNYFGNKGAELASSAAFHP